MNSSALLLHALKGTCALNCLAALHLAGPLPVTQRTIMDLTGFDNSAVRKGLNTLRVLGLATCTGDQHRTAWRLAPAAHSLPLPLDPFLSTGENRQSALLKEEEELITDAIDSNLDSSSVIDASKSPVPEPGPAGTPPIIHQSAPPDELNNHLKTLESSRLRGEGFSPARLRGLSPGNSEWKLRSQFYAAFEAANIYLQFRRPLADALLAEDEGEAPPAGGPAWLRQTLGWICYAQRRLPHVKRGAVVYISLRDRLPCDPAYLPPPELPFEAALAWAARGGEDEPAQAPDDELTFRVSETLKVSASPEDELWQAVIDKLSRELSPAVIDSQLRPARLLSLDHDRCCIAARTPQSRDWLQTRLAPVLARALTELSGRPISIDCVDQKNENSATA